MKKRTVQSNTTLLAMLPMLCMLFDDVLAYNLANVCDVHVL